jgi:hypothetical protein
MCGRTFLYYSVELNGELFPGRDSHPLGPALRSGTGNRGRRTSFLFRWLGTTHVRLSPSLPRFCVAPVQLERAQPTSWRVCGGLGWS